MNIFIHRFMIPAAVTLLLTIATLWALRDHSIHPDFQSILDQVASPQAEVSLAALKAAKKFIYFHETGQSPAAGSPEAQIIANLYYRLGNTLQERRDPPSLMEAYQAYSRSVELFPAVQHGWPYFLRGDILRDKNQLPQAQEQYRQVAFYDFGHLALLADYWIERLNVWQGREVDPYPVYAYMRYGRGDPLQVLQPFKEAKFTETPEGVYLQALIEQGLDVVRTYQQELLERYTSLKPSDYSARYYYDQIRRGNPEGIYPADGDLLPGAHAPHAYRNGDLRLLQDGTLRVDFYVSGQVPPSVTVTLEIDNPARLQGFIDCTHEWVSPAFSSEQPEQLLQTFSVQEESSTFTHSFAPKPGRNVLALYFRLSNSQPGENKPAWIRFQNLRFDLPTAEKTL